MVLFDSHESRPMFSHGSYKLCLIVKRDIAAFLLSRLTFSQQVDSNETDSNQFSSHGSFVLCDSQQRDINQFSSHGSYMFCLIVRRWMDSSLLSTIGSYMYWLIVKR